MNNSSVSRSNHSTRVLVSICFVILLCVVIALWFSKVNAANIVRRTVSMYLDEKQISYTSVHVNNQTLSVELQSGGASLRFESAIFRVDRTSAQRGALRHSCAHTRSRGTKPHTVATRASRRGAGARYARRVDRAGCFHGQKIGTIGTFERNPPLAVAAVRLC